MIIAEKLKANDEIRVVAPAQSLAIIASENRDYAKNLREKGEEFGREAFH